MKNKFNFGGVIIFAFVELFLNMNCSLINAQTTPDTLIMPVSINYIWGSGGSCGNWGGNWGGQYNLSFDQSRNMPPGDMMYVEVETNTICCGNTPWHKLGSYVYPVNWYNDTANYAFTGFTNGTIHTSNDIYGGPGSVGAICIRFVYISNTGNQTIYASVSNAIYTLAPTHLKNVTATINGSSCDNPLNVTFHLPVNCSQCQNGFSSDDVRIQANFGDGIDTFYIVCCPGQNPTFHLNHWYNSVGTYNATFHVWNGYGGGYDTVSITVNPKPPAAITASSTTFCSGDSVFLNAAYNPNRTYQWSKGGIDITGATSSSYTTKRGGAYKVTVTNTITGCSRTTAPATILTKYPTPTPSITAQGPTTFCACDSVVLSANTGIGLTYHWKKDGIFINGASLVDYTATTQGVYKVQEINSYGCKRTSGGIPVTVPCRESDDQSQSTNSISIFPNPTSGKLIIQSPGKINQITITNLPGHSIYKNDFQNNFLSSIEIDLTNQSKGIYVIQVIAGKEVNNQKIILD